MVARPWRYTMLAACSGLVLLLVAGCTRPAGNQGQQATTTDSAQAPQGHGQMVNKVQCSNQGNEPNQRPGKVAEVRLLDKDGKVLATVPGTACGVVWDNATLGNIPSDKSGSAQALTTEVCVWVGDHWECGPRTELPDSAAKAGVKK